ncbi:MAG: RNA degradosome polyphosphate kinase [Christensenellales bacterium]|jgi:polyphosphate kinase
MRTNGKAKNPALFINRELSWLEFNQRVLRQAAQEDNPILERAKFLAITASNLEEFFMIRVASLRDLARSGFKQPDDAGMTPEAQLKAVIKRAAVMVAEQYDIYKDQLMPAIEGERIRLLNTGHLSREQLSFAEHYFYNEVYPVLTPMAVDSSRAFPLILSGSLNIAVLIEKNGREELATVKVPSVLGRVVAMPGQNNFILLEELIKMNMGAMFDGWKVISCCAYKITRNADLTIEEEEAHDLLFEIEKSLKERKWGAVIKLEMERESDERISSFLKERFEVADREALEIDGPIDLTFLFELYSLVKRPSLKYRKFTPKRGALSEKAASVFEELKKRDRFVHHPYDSFDSVLNFLRQAADDKDVLAIKQTLYRVSDFSPVVQALEDAVLAGKQVTVLLEAKARFDEENNISMGKRLEKAGCHVIYGLVGLKTHSKITLVVRREEGGIKRYVHLGTGNYNDKTALIYTDMGLFTADPAIAADATEFFNVLSGYSSSAKMNELIAAPDFLRIKTLELIDREINLAKSGQKAAIFGKMNSLVDTQIIQKLYEASAAGVDIRLIVRGICCLRPGIEGVSENIEVHSIVGRFLEHSRVFMYTGQEGTDIYLSSADWMQRNFDRRIELMFPVKDVAIKLRIMEIMELCWKDSEKTCVMNADGSYTPATAGDGEAINAQEVLIRKKRI